MRLNRAAYICLISIFVKGMIAYLYIHVDRNTEMTHLVFCYIYF